MPYVRLLVTVWIQVNGMIPKCLFLVVLDDPHGTGSLTDPELYRHAQNWRTCGSMMVVWF